eukprot:174444-Lingulodinium_polyedra.AAC.1
MLRHQGDFLLRRQRHPGAKTPHLQLSGALPQAPSLRAQQRRAKSAACCTKYSGFQVGQGALCPPK